jgi:hypothetical protein
VTHVQKESTPFTARPGFSQEFEKFRDKENAFSGNGCLDGENAC